MTKPFHWTLSAPFYERVHQINLHGQHFQDVNLCTRRAWMHLHHIRFAQWHPLIAIGAAKHETSYARDHSTEGLFGLAPDRVDWKNRIVYENKGTGGAAEAVSMQTAFYAVMLSIASGQTWTGITHVLSSKKRREVILDEDCLKKLWNSSEKLEELTHQGRVPQVPPIPLCESCSLAMFCGYD
ncbi:MAG: Dna2/Cas4 domain-containing protein [SAR324 cluster bacterium]|nr:Dna2/Cas4 domain-containing protein [SAR324 cluster bacterium]